MADFINTVDVIGDDALTDSIIMRTITEFKDNNVKTVGTYAFYGCAALGTVELPSATELQNNAFENCSSLVEFSAPKCVKLGGNTFKGCSVLAEVDFPLATEIGSSLFEKCYGLVNVHAPLVARVYSGAMRDCTSLARLQLPSLTRLDANALRCCSKLIVADFPVLNYIGNYAFAGCSLLVALILRSPTVATLVGAETFVYLNEKTPIAEGAGYIYVPKALLSQYASASNWSALASQFRALEDYTVDGTITGDLDATKI